MKRPELLAPVGNMECLKAAIMAGADAVYLGGYAFGARSFAGNFSREELKEAVYYAHLYDVKVYITVNTLLYDDEIELFLNYVDYLVEISVDALILQDLGMFDLIHQIYPSLELHASTQMHLHNLEGVLWAKEMGFHRAVVAREMSIQEIERIKKNVSIELEVFVHGALCISYSGQCLMSSLIGGRSGNRGTCAGSCRQKYDFYTKNGSDYQKLNQDDYVLSTKDLNTLEHIGELIAVGVDSLKIEGRMKRPEYVYLVVSMYRKAIDQYLSDGKIVITPEDIKELQKIFHRGFTRGFLFGDNNIMNPVRPNHMGIPVGKVLEVKKNAILIQLTDFLRNGDGIRILGEEDTGTVITKMEKGNKIIKEGRPGDKILLRYPYFVKVGCQVVKTTDKKQLDWIDKCLHNNTRKLKICGDIKLKVGEKPVLTVDYHGCQVSVVGEHVVEAAVKQPLSYERILEQMYKTGNTVYEWQDLHIEMDGMIFIPIQLLNELRRNAFTQLTEKRLQRFPLEKKKYYRKVPSFPVEKKKNALIYTYTQYLEIKDQDYFHIYVEKEEVYRRIANDSRVILKLPRVLSQVPKEEKPVLVGEIGSLSACSTVFTDFSFNVTNSYTVAFLHSLGVFSITLSYELTDDQIKTLLDMYQKRYSVHPNLELIVVGREEVMVTKFPFVQFYHASSFENFIRDRFGNDYPIVASEHFNTIYHYQERHLKEQQRYYDMGINQLRYQFFTMGK